MGRLGTGVPRKVWLEAGQEILRTDGFARLKLRALATSLQLTTGGFYHHFDDFDAYLVELAEFFATDQLDEYFQKATSLAGNDPENRIFELSKIVDQAGGQQLYRAMRRWGQTFPPAAEAVRQLDLACLKFFKSVFLDIGYSPMISEYKSICMLSVGVAEIDLSEFADATKESRDPIYKYLVEV